MEDFFRSPRAMIGRAKELLDEYVARAQEYDRQHMDMRRREVQPGLFVFEMRVTAPFPEPVTAVITDAVAVCRRALDQAAVAVVRRARGARDEDADRKISFPIEPTANDLVGRIASFQRFAPPEALETLASAGIVEEQDADLALLKRLSNHGHRDLVGVSARPTGLGINPNGGLLMAVLGGKSSLLTHEWQGIILFSPLEAASNTKVVTHSVFNLEGLDGDVRVAPRMDQVLARAALVVDELEKAGRP